MMKKIFSMAALALLMTACGNDIDEPQAQQQPANLDGMITITAKLAPKSEAGTRAVTPGTDSNSKDIIKVTWAADEHLAILYEVSGVKKMADATITAVDDKGVATITFAVESGTADETPCTIVYPLAAAKDDYSGVKDAATLLANQDGTLSANLDVRVGAGTISTSKPSLGVTTQPAAQFAIHKFMIQDLSESDKTATEFKVSDASGNVITTVTPGSATGTLYVALPVMAAGTYWFNATIDSKPYINKATTAAATSAGTYYQSTVKMATVGNVIASDGKFYANNAATPSGNTAVALICYVGNDAETSSTNTAYKHGLALALQDANDGSETAWCSQTGATCLGTQYDNETAAKGDMAGIANTDYLINNAPAGHTHTAASAARNYNGGTHPTGTSKWFLPSAGQWDKMINAAGGYYTLMSNASLQSSDSRYWSSTEHNSQIAWLHLFSLGNWYEVTKNGVYCGSVRSALAF